MPEPQIRLGGFVEVASSPYETWGTGKLLRVAGTTALVQYFDAPGIGEPPRVSCSLAVLRSVRIPAQTRVWRRHAAGRWQVGRVLEHEGSSLFVQFPNSEALNLEAEELEVRWNRPLRDPLILLCAEATETPLLADARAAFMAEVARQNIAAAGIPALLSSSVDLVDYQFEVVRRVLGDPVQRYVLADEVGLGKTIEAGIIIRQHFLDDSSARAVVVVPSPLVAQWRSELSRRFGLAMWLDDFLHVVSHDDLAGLEAVIANTGLLVVDEVHHLSRRGNEVEVRLFELVSLHCQRVSKLLLLSATPVLSDAQGFLRVLHLLDPVVFPLNDLDGFKRRIASRQLVAEVAATLVPENLWGLHPELDRLQAAYSDDLLLCERIAALRAVLDTFPEEEDESFLAKLRELKTHLLESYRLHRRLLRHRRSSVPWATVGRAGWRVATLRTSAAEACYRCWEELRHALNELEQLPDALAVSLLLIALHSRAGTSVRQELLHCGLTDPKMLTLADAVDRARRRWRNDEERFHALVREVRSLLGVPELQVVVFCDYAEDADRAALELQAALGKGVQRHQPRSPIADSDEGEAPWEAFLTEPRRVRVLVCDHRAEEGVNLHGGRKCALHFDLPAAPNRIEQRLGRLDRYGTGDKVRSVILVDEGHSGEAMWAQVLAEGWQVFGRSVASLQYLIESATRALGRAWLHNGSAALEQHLRELGGPQGLVQREIRQIDHQDALDSLAEPVEAAMDDLQDCDNDWRVWRKAFRAFALKALGFRECIEVPGGMPDADTTFRLGYAHLGGGSHTLLPLAGFLRHFLASVDLQAPGGGARFPLSHRYAFSRRNVTPRVALAHGVHLLRVGDPLVTALEQFCEYDDRGRAFAVWRVDREYTTADASGADLFFRFDFVVRAQTDAADGEVPEEGLTFRHALARRADRIMPPFFLRVWVNGAGRVLDSPPDLLESPYCKDWCGTRRDFNLSPKRWRALPQVVRSSWLRDWPALCCERRAQAEAAIVRVPVYQNCQQQALHVLERESRTLQAQGASRLTHLFGAALEQEQAELERERLLHERLRQAVQHPSVRLDVVGALFVASEPLNAV